MAPHESSGKIVYTFEPDPDVKLKGGIILMPDHRVSYQTDIVPKFDAQGYFDLGKEVAAAMQAFCDKLGLAAVYYSKSMVTGFAELCDIFFNRYVNNPDPEPYAPKVFARIESMKAHINIVARKHGVSPIAVAGSIADEFNTYRGKDILQDALAVSGLLVAMTKAIKGSSLEDLLRYFSKPIDSLDLAGKINPALGWALELLPEASRRQLAKAYTIPPVISPDFVNKLTDALANDLGVGNIRLGTAMDSLKDYHGLDSKEVRQMTQEKMAKILNSGDGTRKVTAIILHLARIRLGEMFAKEGLKFPENDKIMAAFLVSTYKQGHKKFLGNVQAKLDKAKNTLTQPLNIKIKGAKEGSFFIVGSYGREVPIEAGEGTRIIHQWHVFKKIFPDN